jgi:hypothetical protein
LVELPQNILECHLTRCSILTRGQKRRAPISTTLDSTMAQPSFDQDQRAVAETSLGERFAKGLAVDVAFGVLLLIVSTLISDFGIAWLIAMGTILALWGTWHFFRHRAQRIASEK